MNCSFCDKTQDDVVAIIAGPDVYICNECISLCVEILLVGTTDTEPLMAVQRRHDGEM